VPSLTVENYLKTIYQISNDTDGEPAATGKIAGALGVSPGTVTSMLKTLNESSLAAYTPYGGVKLTDAGQALAMRVVRRHRLIELFLVTTLGLSWDEVHEEAENMEHAVSDRLIDHIDECLGRPEVDPHGDPIPKADGSMRKMRGRSLSACTDGDAFRLTRVKDQSADFLRYLSDNGLSLGARGHVVSNSDEAGVVTIVVDGAETTLGLDAAAKIFVTAEE
jgi:DtxR family Mn-dependent transcriptional regulator